MNEDLENEEELIKLSEIFDTLKKDALEVSDLLVKGIEYYQLLAYVSIAIVILFAWLLVENVNAGNVILSVFYGFCVAAFLALGPFSFYKNRQLKKKYGELIDIHKSLTEE